MANSFCTKCGTPVPADALFCGSCGNKCKAPAPAKTSPKKVTPTPTPQSTPAAQPRPQQTTAGTSEQKTQNKKFDVLGLFVSLVVGFIGLVISSTAITPMNFGVVAFATFFPILSFLLRKPLDKLFAPLHEQKVDIPKPLRAFAALAIPAIAAFVITFVSEPNSNAGIATAVLLGIPLAHFFLRVPASHKGVQQ